MERVYSIRTKQKTMKWTFCILISIVWYFYTRKANIEIWASSEYVQTHWWIATFFVWFLKRKMSEHKKGPREQKAVNFYLVSISSAFRISRNFFVVVWKGKFKGITVKHTTPTHTYIPLKGEELRILVFVLHFVSHVAFY